MPHSTLAVYVHVPFCARHCAYCDFNTYVEESGAPIVQATVDAICEDVARAGRELAGERCVATLFFGGGTPTFLSGAQLVRLLGAIRDSFPVLPDAEISSEANPGSADVEKFGAMRAAGFNRLSIGVQAFDDALLVALDRFHTAGEAAAAVRMAREAGFTNVNLDLMFRLPGQTRGLWRDSLARAVDLGTEHLSLYALTLEPGTRFERRYRGGKLVLPDEDTEVAMYCEAIDVLRGAGYVHYEVSNFARPGFECRHNLTYWRNEEYLGFGPGAVSYLGGRRWKRERLPGRYVAKVRAGADLTVEEERLDARAALGETILLGLRLRAGVDVEALRRRFGVDVGAVYGDVIRRLQVEGLLEPDPGRLRLTERGLLLADSVALHFV
ncbi:MAG: radical SAM family heme chaperone HemW [Chloroherpetonaceae bacterium]|nr:radical SAM family heme chaperone HemW [Chthonomonadaceae bacterium]MDW8209261.1 radical SAM family heme chaperone HemW [Chloroherpetonaceae bacterium]